MNEFKILKQFLNENGKKFPAQVKVLRGKTIAKTSNWWKAIVLIENKYKNNIKYQLRFYGWQWSDKDKRYKTRQKFNISPSAYVGDIISILHIFLQEVKGKGIKGIDTKLISKLSILEKELNKLRLINQKNQIPLMEKAIKDFEKLLKRKKRKEKEIQKFLYKQFWMFGSNYRYARKETKAGMKGRNDFLLEKETGYHDIVELKKPEHKVFTKSKFPSMSKELKDAISQMVRYFDYYYKNYLSHKDQTNLDVYYPDGLVVIGRRLENERSFLEAHKAVFTKIKILTYDDVLDRAKQTLKTIKKRKK
jgi:hypothetical protein